MPHPVLRRSVVALALLMLTGGLAAPPAVAMGGAASTPAPDVGTAAPPLVDPLWIWPVAGVVSHRYEQPAHAYGPGHRGIDVLVAERSVRAPADGVVLFAGTVVDRPLITIDHGQGIVSTLEPVSSPLVPGTAVAQGDGIGELSAGGHSGPGELHLGARWNGDYVNPLLFLGEVPRAVLLPCC